MPGFLRARDIRSEGMKHGINISIEGLKRMVRLGMIKADSQDLHASHPSSLFKAERLQELLRIAPRARKSNQPGFFSLSQLREEAARKGITDLSMKGLERQIQLGKIKPDDWISPGTRRGPLFKRERLAELLGRAPRERRAIPTGFTTAHQLLVEAQKIDSSVYLRQVQQFLQNSKKDPRFSRNWQRATIERHGEQKRTFFPKEIGDAFIRMVKSGELAGLFAGERGKKAAKPAVAKTVQPIAVRAKRHASDIQALYVGMGKTPSDFGIAVHNMKMLLPGSGPEMREADLARYLKLSPQQMEKCIRDGVLTATGTGTIRLDSVKKLFKNYL